MIQNYIDTEKVIDGLRVGGQHSGRIEENSARELLYAEQRSSEKTQYLPPGARDLGRAGHR
jgi:hypothetical protein